MIDKLIVWFMQAMFGVFFIAMGLLLLSVPYRFIATGPIMELSDGTMRATSAKLSHKGMMWKTWDGWIPIGVNSEGGTSKWKFTIKDGDQTIVACINDNHRVRLHYKDYIWMPFRFGNAHQVDKCEVIK